MCCVGQSELHRSKLYDILVGQHIPIIVLGCVLGLFDVFMAASGEYWDLASTLRGTAGLAKRV